MMVLSELIIQRHYLMEELVIWIQLVIQIQLEEKLLVPLVKLCVFMNFYQK